MIDVKTAKSSNSDHNGRPPLLRLEADFLRPYRWAIGLGLLGLFVQSVLLLPIPLLQGWVLDKLVAAAGAGGGQRGSDAMVRQRPAIAWAIGLALGGTVILHLVRSAISWWTAATMGRISQEMIVAIRGALHRKLMRLPMAYFDAQQTGRLMARVTSDVGSIFMFVRSGIIQLASDLILSLAIAIVLVWLQWRLALVALVTVPLYAINQAFFFSRLRKLSDQIRAQVSALYALLSERVSAVRVVRSFAREELELAELDERIDRHRALSWANTRTAATLGALATMISGLGTVFVIGYGVVLVSRGILSVGELLAFYTLVGQLYQPDRPPVPVPGDRGRHPGVAGAALRDLRRARGGSRPPERAATPEAQGSPGVPQRPLHPRQARRG